MTESSGNEQEVKTDYRPACALPASFNPVSHLSRLAMTTTSASAAAASETTNANTNGGPGQVFKSNLTPEVKNIPQAGFDEAIRHCLINRTAAAHSTAGCAVGTRTGCG